MLVYIDALLDILYTYVPTNPSHSILSTLTKGVEFITLDMMSNKRIPIYLPYKTKLKIG